MGKALAITAFVLLLLSFPIPFLGNYMTLLALAIAAGAALAGETTFTIVTTLLSAIKLFFLSPTWHIAMFGASYMKAVNDTSFARTYGDAGTRQITEEGTASMAHMNQSTLLLTLALLAAPLVCLVIRRMMGTQTTSAPTTN